MEHSPASARFAASLFHYGNLVAALVPGFAVPWFGLSMLVFAINSHHPDSRVMGFNKEAARNFYPITATVLVLVSVGYGFTKALGLKDLAQAMGLMELRKHFLNISPDLLVLALSMWLLLVLVIVPLTGFSLWRIYTTDWEHPEQ